MKDLITDWRTWLVAGILASYAAVFATAYLTPPRKFPSDAEIDRILDHHVDRCEIMKNARTGYACDI